MAGATDVTPSPRDAAAPAAGGGATTMPPRPSPRPRPPSPPPPPPLPSLPSPPPGITFGPITPGPVLDQLKALNAALFPVNYQAQFYKDALAAGDLTHGAFAGTSLVGAIAVRLELIKPPPPSPAAPIARMYVMTVGVAAPHRGQGLGSALLGRALAGAAADPAIGSAYLHVHVANADAIAFYERLGFVRGETVQGYYRRLTPPDAVLLERRLR